MKTLLLFVLGVFGISAQRAQAQTNRPTVQFSGQAHAEVQYDAIAGNPQGRPRWIQTIYVDPTLTVNGRPLSLRFVLSSLESRLRQPFNRLSLRYKWKWGNVWAGDAYPNLSPLTLSGQLLRGGALELSPGIFRFQFAGGKTRRAIPTGSPGIFPAYDQYLFGGALGLGREDGAVFFTFNALYGQDAYRAAHTGFYFNPLSGDSTELNKPRENTVGSVVAGLNLFNKTLSIRGEIAGSHLTRDSRAQRVDSIGGFRPPDFFELRTTSQLDLAYTASARLQLDNTTLEASYKRVGDAYRSFGMPFLQSGMANLNLGVQQRLFKQQLSLNLRRAQWRNNLNGLAPATNRFGSWSANAGLHIPGWPSLQVGYLLGIQANNTGSDSANFNRHNAVLNAGIGYAFRTGRTNHSLNIHAARYRYRFLVASAETDSLGLGSIALNFTARHQIGQPLTLGWGLSFTDNQAGAARPDSRIWAARLEFSGNLFKNKLTPAVRAGWSRQTSPLLKKDLWKFGGSLSWRFHPLFEWGLSAERNDFGNATSPAANYREWVARTFITARW